MIFIRGARQLLTLRGPAVRRGVQHSDLGIIFDGSLLINGEQVHAVGSTRRIENMEEARSAELIDATGKVVMPGFVDSHTRMVFAPPRLKKAPISLGGEGSLSMLRVPDPPASLRTQSPKVLKSRAARWLSLFAVHGTTTLDIRSGQGLSEVSELKGLSVARSLSDGLLEVVPTFTAGRPESAELEHDPVAATEQVTELLLPLIHRRGLAQFCDVDCDSEVFDTAKSRRILRAAAAFGFGLKVQADRRRRSGGVPLAVEWKALSADHLNYAGDDDIRCLAGSRTIAVLLPGATFFRGERRFAPARELIDRGAAVALATGFGPNYSPTLNMPMVLSLACTQMGLQPQESIVAATVNGAAALGRGERIGSLEPGKQADLTIFEVGDYREIPYYFGINLCRLTMKKGRVVYRGDGPPTVSTVTRSSVESGDGRQTTSSGGLVR